MDLPDRSLLERYLADRDEAAFRALLGRYLDLVHGVARRVTGSDDLARDIAQATFLRLAQRAALIPATVSLPAWLHRTARSLAADLVRGEVRRKNRERLAASIDMMHSDSSPGPQDPQWEALAPVIDSLVDSLPGPDREIVLARFYRNESHAVVASRLGLSESLARKRSSRALEKLRGMLGKRGIATSSSALAAMLPAHALSSPAPAALVGSILQASQAVTPLFPGACHSAYLLMSATQKVLIGTAATVFLASLGYAVRPAGLATYSSAAVSRPGFSGELAGDSRSNARPDRVEPTLPTTAEGRRKRLDQILAIPNPAARRRELLVFVDLLQPGQFEDLCAAFPMDNAPYVDRVDFREEQEILLAAWAQKDPEGALARLKPGWMSFSATLLAKAMGTSHPESAAQWASDQPVYREYFLAGLGKVDLPAAIAAIHELPDTERGKMLHYIWASLGEEPAILERMTALLEPGPDRTYLLRKVADMEAYSRPASALASLKSDPEALQQANIRKIFGSYASKDFDAAIAALEDLPSGPVRLNAIDGITENLFGHDPAQAFALLERYPESANDATIANVAVYAMNRSGFAEQALKSLERIADPAARDQALVRCLQVWPRTQPAQHWEWWQKHSSELPPAVIQGLEQGGSPVLFRPIDAP